LYACAGADGDLAEENRALAVGALRNLSDPEASDDPDRVSEAFDALMSIKLRGGKKGNWSGDDLSLVKDALKRLRTRVQDEIKRGLVTLSTGPADEKLAEVLPALFSAFVRVSESLAEAKRRTRVLDFADLEACALRALEYEEVRSYYHKRWEAFLVDECQDTNPVQAEILDRLTGGAKLSVVGDEKQSIYGFRRADVGVFRGFRARVDEAPDGTEEVLATTFRSHGSLISKLNAVFSPVLGDLHQNLYANRVEPPHPAPHVRLFAVESEEKVGKAALERVEAAHIAGLVRQMVDDGIPVHDGSRTRPAGPEDFAVLSRTWSPLEGCGEALSAVGIPSVHAGGGNLLNTREAKDGQMMLRFLAHPEDGLALVAVLRSPFFAVDDPTLHGIALNMGVGESWWDAIQACDEVPEPLSLAREVIQELLDRSRTEGPGALLASADRLTGYTAVISNLSGSERREADWRGFVELVRDLEVGHGSVFAVTRSLGRMREADVGVPRPVVAAEGAVSLMTIHSAKGLEWPVVILPDLSRVPPSFSPKVLFDPGLGVGLDFGDEVGKDADPPVVHRLIKDRRTRQRKEEDKRLFYVALTRARDHLILTTTDADTQSDCGMALLRPGFEAAGVEAVPVPFGSTCRGPDQLGVPVDLRFTSEVTKKGANTTKHGENS
jgi:ATP-dependent helicase/nuclease subunit A